MGKNTHVLVTIKDPSRWYLSYGKIRKHYLQLHASIWADLDFINLSNDAKLLFLWLKNASLRVNNATFSVCLESAYVSLRVSLGFAKGLLKELESNDFIELQTKLRVSIEEKKIEENKTKNNLNSSKLECISEIVSYLNNATGKKYRADSSSTTRLITALLNNNYTYEDFTKVIDIKCSQWKNTEMEKYLRPQTLFGNKFDAYLNEEKKLTEADIGIMFDNLGR